MEETAPKTEEVSHPSSIQKSRSFAKDLAESMDGKGLEMLKKQNEEKLQQKKEGTPLYVKNAPFFIIGVLFLIVAVGGIVYTRIYLAQIHQTVPIAQVQAVSSLISSDGDTAMSIVGKNHIDIYNELVKILSGENIRPNSVQNISVIGTNGKKASVKEFFTAIKSHMPDTATDAVSEYMIGLYAYNTNKLFVVLQAKQHDAFAIGMKEWETYLLEDMAPLFGLDIFGSNTYLTNIPFSSNVIENHDTRTVFDKDKNAVLFYSFIDPNTLIIATDPKTLMEVNRRWSSTH